MPTTALSVARFEMARRARATTPTRVYSTTTEVTTNNLVISTELSSEGYDTDDYFNNDWWIYLLDGNNVGVIRRVTDYVGSTGTVTVSGAALSTQAGVTTFSLFRHHPTVLRDVLNDASRDAYPFIHRRVVDESVFTSSIVRRYLLPSPWNDSGVADAVRRLRQVRAFRSPYAQSYTENILDNGGFEDWTGATADSWTATNLTIAEESATTSPKNYAVLKDDNSVKATAQASSVGDLTQTISTPTTHDGLNFVFCIWVYCTTSARVFARITLNAVTTDSANHNGTGWEPLVVKAEATVVLTTLSFGVHVSSGTAIIFYIDEAIALAGPYDVPIGEDEVLRGWRIEEQVAASPGLAVGIYLVLAAAPPDRYQLRLVGTDYLTQLSAEADTVEIGTPQTEILYAYALRRLARSLQGENEAWEKRALAADIDVAFSTAKHKMQVPPYIGLPYDLGR